MKEYTIRFWKKNPLKAILIIAFVVRLFAAVFSGGYGMHDDHFLVIETAQSWVDGSDYNNWLPESQMIENPDKEPKPDGHSLLYPGFNYVVLSVLKWVGITDFGFKMFIIRFLHALLSLITVYAGYQMTRILSDQKSAAFVGVLLALFWWQPFFSVRNLVEVVAIPFVMVGMLWLLENEKNRYVLWRTIAAGLVLGLAFSIRFQTSFIAAGVGFVFLINKNWKDLFMFSGAYVLALVVIQGGIDLIIWNRPFAELTEYILYNIENKNNYGVNNYSMYFLVLIAVLVPPVSLLWFFGWFRSYKKSLILWLPTIFFFLFHTLFPNKQERFIITIAPLVIVLGVVGWKEYMNHSKFWQNKTKLYKVLISLFWIFNVTLLIPVSLTFSKRSRVVTCEYLSEIKSDISSIMVEDANRTSIAWFPLSYLEKWVPVYNLPAFDPNEKTNPNKKGRRSTWTFDIETPLFFEKNGMNQPDIILFIGSENLKERVQNIEKYWDMDFLTEIKSGLIDQLFSFLNPQNVNESIFIFQTIKSKDKKAKPKCCV